MLLPNDLDLKTGMLYVRNKPQLGWQVKTRIEREFPLIDKLRDVLKITVGERETGPVFLQRRYTSASARSELNGQTEKQLEDLLQQRVAQEEASSINTRDGRTEWRRSMLTELGGKGGCLCEPAKSGTLRCPLTVRPTSEDVITGHLSGTLQAINPR